VITLRLPGASATETPRSHGSVFSPVARQRRHKAAHSLTLLPGGRGEEMV